MFAPHSKRRKDIEVAVGQRFRKADAPRIIWEVELLFEGVDGVSYATMFRIDDPTMRKTVARASLEKGHQYQPVHRQ